MHKTNIQHIKNIKKLMHIHSIQHTQMLSPTKITKIIPQHYNPHTHTHTQNLSWKPKETSAHGVHTYKSGDHVHTFLPEHTHVCMHTSILKTTSSPPSTSWLRRFQWHFKKWVFREALKTWISFLLILPGRIFQSEGVTYLKATLPQNL